MLAVTESRDIDSTFCKNEKPSNPPKQWFSRRSTEIDSSLRKLGVRQRRTTRYVCFPRNQQGRKLSGYHKEIISEENEYIIDWNLLGRGIRWSRGQIYNGIMPSLRVYPVIPWFSEEIEDLFREGNLRDIQEMLHSGNLHPFTQEARFGRSLLYVRFLLPRINDAI